MNLFDFEQPYDPRDQGVDWWIVDAKESVEDSWLERPSIYGVGIYHQQDGADAIEVWADTGTDIDSLSLPQTVWDVPVIVRVADAPDLTSVKSAKGSAPTRQKTDEAHALRQDNNRYNPLVGGISICPVPAVGQGIGTLGVVVADPGSGNGASVLVTAAHVLTAHGSPLTSPIVQPGISTNPGADVVGNGVRSYLGNYLFDPNEQVYVGIDVGVGDTTSRPSTADVIVPNIPLIGVVPPRTGMHVHMRGASTQGTQGMINHTNTVIQMNVNGTAVRMDSQFGVEGIAGPFGAPGDSGALVLVNTPNGLAAVGMAVAIDPGPPNLVWASPWPAIAMYMLNS